MSTIVQIPMDSQFIEGSLDIPQDAKGLVLFAHGSASDRRSPRNRFVAEFLNEAGFGTLVIDLLTPKEKAVDHTNPGVHFDIGTFAVRLLSTTDWVANHADYSSLSIGYFGSSIGAAAALYAARERADRVSAIVSRGGRVDLAKVVLPLVHAPTLLIVSGNDPLVLKENREALYHLNGEKKLEVIESISHLFEDSGAMKHVAQITLEWFRKYLAKSTPSIQQRIDTA
jgi:putative phosphoribosyl transferase